MSGNDDRWTDGGLHRKAHVRPKAGEVPRHRCTLCHGRGVLAGITKVQGRGKGMGSDYGPCPECDGSGWLSEDPDLPTDDSAD